LASFTTVFNRKIIDCIMLYYKVITRYVFYCINLAPSAFFCKSLVILHYAVLQSDYTILLMVRAYGDLRSHKNSREITARFYAGFFGRIILRFIKLFFLGFGIWKGTSMTTVNNRLNYVRWGHLLKKRWIIYRRNAEVSILPLYKQTMDTSAFFRVLILHTL
jgi:hypothetical protein